METPYVPQELVNDLEMSVVVRCQPIRNPSSLLTYVLARLTGLLDVTWRFERVKNHHLLNTASSSLLGKGRFTTS